jgi:hypothetical protein
MPHTCTKLRSLNCTKSLIPKSSAPIIHSIDKCMRIGVVIYLYMCIYPMFSILNARSGWFLGVAVVVPAIISYSPPTPFNHLSPFFSRKFLFLLGDSPPLIEPPISLTPQQWSTIHQPYNAYSFWTHAVLYIYVSALPVSYAFLCKVSSLLLPTSRIFPWEINLYHLQRK